MILVIGGSGSGKSSYAENYLQEAAMAGEQLYYIATMQVYGEEGREKIRRHREQRSGKGMITIEQPRDLAEVLRSMSLGTQPCGALLEDLGNLVANEMFSENGEMAEAEAVTAKLLRECEELDKSLRHFIIVTNNVFEDGTQYDEGTRNYIRALGEINCGLAGMAERVVELVVGIPVEHRRSAQGVS